MLLGFESLVFTSSSLCLLPCSVKISRAKNAETITDFSVQIAFDTPF